MEDFPILLLFLILYLITAFSGNKKKKRKRGSMRTRAQGEQMDVREAMHTRQTKVGFDEAFSQHVDEPDTCDMKRIHLHAVDQAQFSRAQEGEDPCHAGGVTGQNDAPEELMQEMPGNSAPSQDVLHGVIMSEILMRPHERAAMRRGRR